MPTPLGPHCVCTSSIWVWSSAPATSIFPSAITCARVASTGAAVSTGEQIRIRRFARPIAFAIRCESASPKPGQNHGRTSMPSTCTGRGSTVPVPSTFPSAQSCSKSSMKAWASSGESTTAITFSSRDQESSVQFVDPVHTALWSRTTNLWCIRSGTPAIAFVGTDSRSTSSGTSLGGAGTGIGARKSALYASRTATPRRPAASIVSTTSSSRPGPSAKSYSAMSRESFAATRKSWSWRAIVAGSCPPSVSVVTVIMSVCSLPRYYGTGRWFGATRTSRSTTRPSSGSSPAVGRRRAEGSPRACGWSSSPKQETRRRIAELADESYYVERGLEPWISRAPVHVVVAMREDDYHDRYRRPDKLLDDGSEVEWRVPWWWVDAGKSIMLLLLAAVDEGLGAGLFGLVGDANDGLRELLGMPADLEIVGVVTIGHAAPATASGSRSKFPWKPLEEVVRWEHW